MGNFFSSIGDFFSNIFDDIGKFWGDVAIWFIGLWSDFTFAYYVCQDLILVAGPFIGFLLYAIMSHSPPAQENITVNISEDMV